MLGVQVPGHQEGRPLAKFCLQTCLSDRYLLPVLPFLSQVFFFLMETSSFSLPSGSCFLTAPTPDPRHQQPSHQRFTRLCVFVRTLPSRV